MNAQQIKDEIRKLSRIDKIEIYRWIDEEAAADLLSRSECKVTTLKSASSQPWMTTSGPSTSRPATLNARLDARCAPKGGGRSG